MSFELAIAAKTAVVLGVACSVSLLLRRASAAARHTVWAAGLWAALALPAAAVLLPSLDIPVLPTPDEIAALPIEAGSPVDLPPAAAGPSLPIAAGAPIGPPMVEAPIEFPVEAAPGIDAQSSPRLGWTSLIWGLGALAVVFRSLLGFAEIRRLRRRSRTLIDADWSNFLVSLKRDLAVRSPVELRIADGAIPPMTWGFFRHTILLPAAALAWPEERKRLVLAHELAHVKRNDGLTQMLGQICCSVYWFNPLAWYAAYRLGAERERACDDVVLSLGADAGDYADHLLQIARGIHSGHGFATVSMAHPSQLETRLHAILDPQARRQALSRLAVVVLLISIGLLTASAAAIQLTALAPIAVIAEMQAPAAGNAPAASGDLAIHGIVMVPGSRAPVPGARVRLAGPAATATMAFALGPHTTVTADAGGRFSFTGLAPGRYDIGPVFPQDPETFRRPGKPMDIAEGVPSPLVELWLEPASQISGRIFDPDGEPVAGALVGAMIPYWETGVQRLSGPIVGGGALTDADGRYTLSVPPGKYYLGVWNSTENPPSNEMFPPQYYPGVFQPDEAVPVTVPAGIELGGMDFRQRRNELFRVQFHFPLPEYLPGVPEPIASYLDGSVAIEAWVHRLRRGAVESPPYRIGLSALGGDTYLSLPLPRGEYELLLKYPVSLFSTTLRRALNWNVREAASYGNEAPIVLQRITLEDRDLDLGTIPHSSRIAIPGRIGGVQDARFDLSEFPDFSFFGTVFQGHWPVTPASDGTFTLDGVYPGLFGFFTAPQPEMPDGFYVASVRSGGQDILRDGLQVNGPVDAIEIMLANDAARIAGVARNDSGALAPGARIILIPPVSRRGPLARFPATLADHNGAFNFDRVPPGQYRLLALDLAGMTERPYYWESPEFLREFELRGQTVTVDPRARMVINPETVPLIP